VRALPSRATILPANGVTELDHGLSDAALPGHEPGEQARGRHEQDERVRGQPGMFVGLDQRVREEEDPGPDEERPERVKPLGLRVARLTHEAERQHEGGDADRQVDPEDRRPVEEADQQTADDRPGSEADPRCGRPDADCGRAPLLGERIDQDRERERCHQRGTDALQSAEGDQVGVVGRERACAGEHRERGQADEEDALAPVPISQRAADEDERRERKHVGVDHPLQVARRDTELALDRGQRHVHDRVVQQDHALPDAHRDKRQPSAALAELIHGRSSPADEFPHAYGAQVRVGGCRV
jgi:hypothetical protein